MDMKTKYPVKKGDQYEASDGAVFGTYDEALAHQAPINKEADIQDPYRMLGDQRQKLRP